MDDIDAIISRNDFDFKEAADYFKNRIPVTSDEFYRLSDKYRNIAFTVSGYTKAEILKRFYDELLSSIEEGKSLKDFRKSMNSFLESEGYEGLTPFQADNIFRTNMQTAYNVGHYEQMTEPTVLKLRPYWQYDAVNDSHTRPSHLAMDGKVFPADSPVWDTWYPPNGYRCRCSVRSLSQRQVEQQGLKVESEVPAAGILPDGRVAQILPDTQFNTNPAKKQFKPDFTGYPKSIVEAFKSHENNHAPS